MVFEVCAMMLKLIAGQWEKIGGVDTYVSVPSGEYPKDKAILFLADALGPRHINSQVPPSFDPSVSFPRTLNFEVALGR